MGCGWHSFKPHPNDPVDLQIVTHPHDYPMPGLHSQSRPPSSHRVHTFGQLVLISSWASSSSEEPPWLLKHATSDAADPLPAHALSGPSDHHSESPWIDAQYLSAHDAPACTPSNCQTGRAYTVWRSLFLPALDWWPLSAHSPGE